VVGNVDDGGVQAVFHSLGEVSTADADSSAGQVAGRVTDAERAVGVFHLGVTFDFLYRLEGPVSVTGYVWLHRHIDGEGKNGGIEEDFLRLEGILIDSGVEDFFCKVDQFFDAVGTARPGRFVFADQQPDKGEVVFFFQW